MTYKNISVPEHFIWSLFIGNLFPCCDCHLRVATHADELKYRTLCDECLECYEGDDMRPVLRIETARAFNAELDAVKEFNDAIDAARGGGAG